MSGGNELKKLVEEALKENDIRKLLQMGLESEHLRLLLSWREEIVLRALFGMGFLKPKTFKEIGEFLGLSRDRVINIEIQALQKLKRRWRFILKFPKS